MSKPYVDMTCDELKKEFGNKYLQLLERYKKLWETDPTAVDNTFEGVKESLSAWFLRLAERKITPEAMVPLSDDNKKELVELLGRLDSVIAGPYEVVASAVERPQPEFWEAEPRLEHRIHDRKPR